MTQCCSQKQQPVACNVAGWPHWNFVISRVNTGINITHWIWLGHSCSLGLWECQEIPAYMPVKSAWGSELEAGKGRTKQRLPWWEKGVSKEGRWFLEAEKARRCGFSWKYSGGEKPCQHFAFSPMRSMYFWSLELRDKKLSVKPLSMWCLFTASMVRLWCFQDHNWLLFSQQPMSSSFIHIMTASNDNQKLFVCLFSVLYGVLSFSFYHLIANNVSSVLTFLWHKANSRDR